MELNKTTIGPWRTFDKDARKATYWKWYDVAFIAWAVLVLMLVPFAFGAVFGEWAMSL